MAHPYFSTLLLFLWLLPLSPVQAQESNCGNGIDDDDDGLIDCFDGDCSGVGNCDDFFFGQPQPVCGFTPPPLQDIEVNLLYKTDEARYPIDQRSGVYVGDMNGDGVPDLVSRDNGPPRIQIFSGDDGRILQSIVTPRTHPYGQTAIADVDGDGRGDVFQVEYTGRLARYEFGNPNAVWRTATNVGDDNSVSLPQLADINQDGRPEVYVGDRVFDALTGVRYVDGGSNVNVGGYLGGGNSDRLPIYFDLFQPGDPRPDGSGNFGPEADGLEYIAGNQVWTVDFTTGVANSGGFRLAAQFNGPSNERDGFTSIADINGDGLMDIAVMDAGRVYAWDPYTNQRIGAGFDVPVTGNGGRINIGDFDGDGDVELGFAGRNIYIVRDYTSAGNGDNSGSWSTLWQKTGLDDGSQRTGSTLFDFDGDGMVEVVYSEEENLFIYRGSDGAELFRTQSRAGTRTEYPIVADVNGDGQAEIVVTAQATNGPSGSGTGWISVYSSANQPWVPARRVWNQHGYNVVNINDDLTVPQFQQNPLNPAFGGRYNNFLVQTSVGGDSITNVFPAPDAIIDVAMANGQPVIDFSDCPDNITATLVIDNQGDAPLPASTPIAFYVNNPRQTAATLIQSTTLGTQVEAGDRTTVDVTIPVGSVAAGAMIFLSVNDPGFAMADLPFSEDDFPLTGTAECDYSNNVSFIGNVRCGEICGDGADNDGDGLVDEPNLFAPVTRGCPGEQLPPLTVDVDAGTYSAISSSGTTVSADGTVTLGGNLSGQPDVDTIIFDDGICFDTVLVTTVDDLPPTLRCPGNRTVTADANCGAPAAEYTGLAQVSDNCPSSGAVTREQSISVGTALSPGPNPVTITATDPSGNTTTCTFTVTVADRTPPTITACAPATDLPADANCNAPLPDLTGQLTATDNCTATGALTVTQDPAVATLSGAGATRQVRLTVRDAAGNAANCVTTVRLVDQTDPTIQCPGDATRDLAAADCTLAVPDFRGQAGRQDNCARYDQLTVTQLPAPGQTITTPGATTVTLTVTDPAGNFANCSFTLTAVDRQAPNLSCPPGRSVDADPADCNGTVPDLTGEVTAADNCGPAGLTLSQQPAAGATFAASSQNVTIIAEDAAGNRSQCNVTLTRRDITPPTLNCPPDQQLTVNASCLAILPDFTGGAASDACGGVSVVQTPGPGTNLSNDVTVTLRATDNEQQVTTCSFNVTVTDQVNPVIDCPPAQTLAVDGNCTVPLPDYTSQASARDNCDPRRGPVTVSQAPAPGTPFSGDGTVVPVTLTATDASGNTADCTFPVTLEDMQDPSLTCPVSPQVSELDANCAVALPDFTDQVSVSSNCSTSGITLAQNPAPGTAITGVGITQVTITATDAAGNAVNCTFDFQTIDVTDPVITCPADVTATLDANCAFAVPDYSGQATATDNCTANPTITQDAGLPPTVTGDGTVTQIRLVATDASGNTAACTFTLTTEDATPPALACPPDQTLPLDDGCALAVPDYRGAATASDNCSAPAGLALTQQSTSGPTLSGAGSVTTVTVTATDEAGNPGSCSFTLTARDTTSPTITCPQPVTLELDAACRARVPALTGAATAADNCTPAAGITLTQDLTPGATLTGGEGATETVTLTATDGSGNTANCTVLLTLDDVTPPTVACPAAQDLVLDPNCSVALPDYRGQLTLDDNCTPATALTVQQMMPPGTTVSGAGTAQTISFTVDDGNGNASNCSFTVTLRDRTPPTITCPTPTPLPLNANCVASLPDYRGMATVDDACATAAGVTVSQAPLPERQLTFSGDQLTVTLTARDGNGNAANCSFTVTAADQTPPTITCPADRDVAVDANCAFTVPNFTGEAAVADNCSEPADISVIQDRAVGAPLGGPLDVAQTVTLTVTDAAGNSADCAFTLTPVDETAPAVLCPQPQAVFLDAAACAASLPDYRPQATTSDNCTAPGAIGLAQAPAPGFAFAGLLPSDTTVVLTATDASGNQDTCRFTVAIRDTVRPVIVCPTVPEVVLDEDCNGVIPPITAADSSDNCGATVLDFVQLPEAGTPFGGDGTTVTVTLVATDPSGNAGRCTTTVTFQDRTPPIPTTCPGGQTIDVNSAFCPVPLPDYTGSVTVDDNCRARADILLTQTPSPDSLVMGTDTTFTVTVTSDDGNGNTNNCNFTVTLRDTVGVALTCPGRQLIIASGDNCDALLPDFRDQVVTSDDCEEFPPAGTITQRPSPDSVLTRDILNQPFDVVIRVDDGSGNITRCTIEAVLIDTLPPAITCPPAQQLPVDADCSALVPDFSPLATVTDNCYPRDSLTFAQTPDSTTILTGPDDQRTVTLTVTDPDGNRSNCQFPITVLDTTPPVVTCPAPDTLLLDPDCAAVIGDYTSAAVLDDNCTATDSLTIVQEPAPGTLLSGHLSTDTITITATDGSGNSQSCSFPVTAVDRTPPTVFCPGGQVLRPDANCTARLPDYRSQARREDNCTASSAISITQRPAPGLALTGQNAATEVTLLVDDGNGNVDSCTFTARVLDNTPPQIACPPDTTIALDPDCAYDLDDFTAAAAVTDNCTAAENIILTQDLGVGETFTGAGTLVELTLTADDRNGNTIQCQTTITLADTTSPTILCPGPDTVLVDAACNATVPDYRALAAPDDNCTAPDALAVTQAPAPNTAFGGDDRTETITLTVDDGNGNSANCSFTLTLEDREPPTITCPPNQEIFVDGNCTTELPDYTELATVGDNCTPVASITVSQSGGAAGAVFSGLGTQTVTLTADDGNGNTSDCSFSVTVSDNTPPELLCPPTSAVAADAGCTVIIPDYLDSISVADNCGPLSPAGGAVTLTQSPLPGATFPGPDATQDVTLTARDPSGNTTVCTITVIPADTTRPTIACPADTTLALDATCAATLPDYRDLAAVADNCTPAGALTITQSPPAGTPRGRADDPTLVTLTVTDARGNEAACDFAVALIDTLPPAVACPANDTISVEGPCVIDLPDYTAQGLPTDNCSAPESITIVQRPAPGTDLSGDGTKQTVTLVATDEAGNVDSCQFTVVLEDTTEPMITCPADQELTVDENCSVPLPDYTDASVSSQCDQGETITVVQRPPAGTLLSGDRTVQEVTLVATDASGNRDSCAFSVLLRDRTAPAIVGCPGDTTLALDADCGLLTPDFWSTAPATAQDNCTPTGTPSTTAGAGQITYRQLPAPGTPLAGAGTRREITLTADDNNGNQTSCAFRLTLADTTAPTIVCPADTVANPDANCNFALDDYRSRAAVADNCDSATDGLTLTQSPPPGTVLNGDSTTQTITLTVTDASGNQTSCEFSLMLQDTTPPAIACPPDRTEVVDGDCALTLPDYTELATTDDNCPEPAGITVIQSPAPGSVFTDEGTQLSVTLTADDGNGNTSDCSFRVLLDDRTPPELRCPTDTTVFLDADCTAPLPELTTAATLDDNCLASTSPTITQSPPADGTPYRGDGTVVPVTLTADDGNGNRSNCVIDVLLRDTLPPAITCPPNDTLPANDNCRISVPDYTGRAMITDNCAPGGAITVSQDVAAATLLNGAGTEQTIVLTADDGNGNQSSCAFTLTVADRRAPTIVCPPARELVTDEDCRVLLPDFRAQATVDDNCTAPAALTVSQQPEPGTEITGVQTLTVTLIVDDGNGNRDSCAFPVTLVDGGPPSILCPSAQDIRTGTDCQFTLLDYRPLSIPDDNCADEPFTVEQFPAPGTTVDDLGTVTDVTLVVTDAAGNTGRCVFTVTTRSDTPPPAPDTVVLATVDPPTGSGTVDLRDALDPLATSNLSNRDLDGGLDAGPGPFLVEFYPDPAAAAARTGALDPAGYDPTAQGDSVAVRLEDPATGCFTVSLITFVARTPGTSAAVGATVCNRAPFRAEIAGRPQPAGTGTTIARHEWRIVDPGPTGIRPANLLTPDEETLVVNTEGLRSGSAVLEYQFFEDYGDGPLVPSVPRRVTLTLNNVDCGAFFWDGN